MSSCHLTVTSINEAEAAKRATDSSQLNKFGPRFEKLLCDLLANEGDDVVFECIVVGHPMPTIKWFLSNNEIFESDRIQFVHNETDGNVKLILKNVTHSDKGVYTVQAINCLGDAKCFSQLIVKSINTSDILVDAQQINSVNVNKFKDYFLTFKERFSDKNVRIGDTVKFECIVTGKPTPKIRWFFNDIPVQGKNFLNSISGDRQILTIPSVGYDTIGKISCCAENDSGKDVCEANLVLADDLKQQSFEQANNYTEEYNTESSNVIIMKNLATTKRTSEIRTYQADNDLPYEKFSSQQQIIDFGDNRSTNELNKIAIQQSETENKIILKSQRKNSAPRFISSFIGKIVEQGSNTTLEAIIDGFPVPEIQITKNDMPLKETENIKIAHHNNRITISLNNISSNDAGRYSCSAVNSIGNAASTADIVVKSK